MKEYMKPELEVREIRVSENLAATWSFDKKTGAISIYSGLIALTAEDSAANS
ncbi:MAG: hypothetical protein IKM15_00965 [Peptococcaceae bacterium]|nr:hypothetical protein [Peptococcaceae bacterium]